MIHKLNTFFFDELHSNVMILCGLQVTVQIHPIVGQHGQRGADHHSSDCDGHITVPLLHPCDARMGTCSCSILVGRTPAHPPHHSHPGVVYDSTPP